MKSDIQSVMYFQRNRDYVTYTIILLIFVLLMLLECQFYLVKELRTCKLQEIYNKSGLHKQNNLMMYSHFVFVNL